jgi:hypothetical protein
MVAVPLGLSSYRRRGARTPEISLVNMMIEKDPTNQVDSYLRLQRPGLAPFANVGTGPIRGTYRRLGVLASVYLVVSGASLYSVTPAGVATRIGATPGSDLVGIDGSITRAIVVSTGAAFSTDGTTITQVNMPNAVPVSSVLFIDNYFLLTQQDSHRVYWLAPGDVDPDPLNFFSVENSQGNIVRAARLLDEVWFFSQQTTAVFVLTSDPNAPFQPMPGRLYEKGCASRASITALDNTLFWVGNDRVAYRADTTPVRISDHSIEERLRDVADSDISAWSMLIDGHSLYCINIAAVGTFVFDVENPSWGRWKSYGQETWRARIGCQVSGGLVIAGDDTAGTLWKLDPTISNDNGTPLERVLTGNLTVLGKPQPCRDFSLRMATGWAPITGAASDPIVQLRFSDDGGEIWSSWLDTTLGLQGQYKSEVVWRQLGLLSDPGRIFQVRMTDDAIFRVSFARMNEANSI